MEVATPSRTPSKSPNVCLLFFLRPPAKVWKILNRLCFIFMISVTVGFLGEPNVAVAENRLSHFPTDTSRC